MSEMSSENVDFYELKKIWSRTIIHIGLRMSKALKRSLLGVCFTILT